MFATTYATSADASLQINGLSNQLVSRVTTVSLKPGEYVTIQSGNSDDSYWTPKAQMLVLEVHEGKFGTVIATGICKRDDGALSLKMECIQHGVGEIFYCTRALYDFQMMRYLDASSYNRFTRLMAQFSDEIENLEAYTELHKNHSVKEVSPNVHLISPSIDSIAAAMKPMLVVSKKDQPIEIGKVYEAQLGNEGDTHGYVETAPILIVRKEDCQYGEQWTAIAKKPDGTALFLYNVIKYRVIGYKLYCTRALSEDKLSNYAGSESGTMRNLHYQFRNEFDALPAFEYSEVK